MAARGGEGLGERVSNVWSYLDRLAENNPAEYKRFVDKAMKERSEYMDPPRPIFCFSTGIRGKENQKLFVNVCKWTRVPVQKDVEGALIPVKGGVLRHLVEGGKRLPNSILVDVAFNPSFVDSFTRNPDTRHMFLDLVLDFVDEYLSLLTNRNAEILPGSKFRGSESDIYYSLDQKNPELISRESWMDFGDALLTSLKKGKKTKAARKGSNGLPPLFSRQQSNPGNGSQATPKLVEEVKQSNNKSQKNGRNGGKNGRKSGRKKSSHQNNKTEPRENDSNGGRSLEESGRGSEESNDTESGGSVGESGEGRKMPVNSVMVGEEGGREVVIVRVKLPEVASADQINLDGSETDVCVAAADTYFLSVPFPFPVRPKLSVATFNKRSRTLTVKLPIVDTEED